MTIENMGVKLYQGLKQDRVSDSLGSSADGTNTGITQLGGKLGGSLTTVMDTLSETPLGADLHMYSGSDTARGEIANSSSSALIGTTVTKVTMKLKKASGATGTATVGIWNGSTLKQTIGTIDVSTLTTSYADYAVENTGATHSIVTNDEIGIEYSGSTAIYAVRIDTTSVFDGTHSARRYDSHGTTDTATDMVMKIEGYTTGAYSLSGTNPLYFANAKDNKLLPETGDFTIACWVKHSGHSDHQQIFRSQDSSGSSKGEFRINHSGTSSQDDRLALALNDGTNGTGGNSATVMTTNAVPQNEWVHLACTRTGATVKLYINGTLETNQNTSGTFSANMKWGNDTPRVGRMENANETLQGSIDDLAVWHRVLTATEIQKLYNNNGGGTAQLVSSLTDKSELKAYYSMDSTSLGSPTYEENFSNFNSFSNTGAYTVSTVSNNAWYAEIKNTGHSGAQTSIPIGTTISGEKFVIEFPIEKELNGSGENFAFFYFGLGSVENAQYDTTGQNLIGTRFDLGDSTNTALYTGYKDNSATWTTNWTPASGNWLPTDDKQWVRISKDGTTMTTAVYPTETDLDNSTNALFTPNTITVPANLSGLQYIQIQVSNYNSNGGTGTRTNYATIDNIKIYSGISSPTGCKNDASSTPPISDLTGVRTNSIFEQTDSTPSYWWYNGTSWLLDGSVTKGAISSNWTEVAGSSSTKNITVDTANSELDCKFYGVASNGNGSVAYFDMGSDVGNEWVLRFTINYSTQSGNQGVGFVGLFDEITASDDSQDGIYVVFLNNDNVVNGNGINGATPNDSWGTNISATLSNSTDYFVTLARTAEGTATIDIKTGSHSGSSISNYPANCSNISSNITGLRYIKVLDRKGYSGSNGDVATIKDLGLQKGVTEWLE